MQKQRATYVTFCTFCKCCDCPSSKRKCAWCRTCTVDKHTENSTLNVCLTSFERAAGIWIIISKTLLNLITRSTLKCALTSVQLSICSFHRTVRPMLFLRSWQKTLRPRYVKIRCYGALTSFTSLLSILIWKSGEKMKLLKC